MKTPRTVRTHKTPTSLKTFLFGAPYYPEHWTEADMKDDTQRMSAAGFNVVRLAEFAWDSLEPEPGVYNLAYFDAHIERLGKAGIKSMLCTPTATPPAWLTTAHPAILRKGADGRELRHGSRQHACHSSKLYRQYSRKITQAMAEHYADNPNVIGWQTDNEMFCHFSECHCSNCQEAFREFLQKKYGTIRELNHRWGNAFWALTYNRFSQIQTPIDGLPTHINPSQTLDYHLFLSSELTDFQQEQIDILREANPGWWITHNGVMKNIDYRQFTRGLDFFGVDIYPMFSRSVDRAWDVSSQLDITRSFSGNFIVPELQSGPGGQSNYFHDNPRPGQMRLFAWQCIARGADGILHFRWRTCRFGAEQYWCGILDHDNIPRRRYAEAAQEGAEFAKLGSEILGTWLEPEVAVLYDSGLAEMGHGPITCGLDYPNKLGKVIWKSWWQTGHNVGFVHPQDDLAGIKLIFMPSWAIVTPEVAAALESFVTAGGTLVITARSGIKNADSHVISQTPPGLLARLTGCHVEEATRVNEPEEYPNSFSYNGHEIQQEQFAEILSVTTGKVQATWKLGHYAGQPAVVENKLGAGTCIYIATFLNADAASHLIPSLQVLADVKPMVTGLPANVEVSVRTGNTHKLWFFLNHNSTPVTIAHPPAGTDLLAGKAVAGTLNLEGFGVAVIQTAAEASVLEARPELVEAR